MKKNMLATTIVSCLLSLTVHASTITPTIPHKVKLNFTKSNYKTFDMIDIAIFKNKKDFESFLEACGITKDMEIINSRPLTLSDLETAESVIKMKDETLLKNSFNIPSEALAEAYTSPICKKAQESALYFFESITTNHNNPVCIDLNNKSVKPDSMYIAIFCKGYATSQSLGKDIGITGKLLCADYLSKLYTNRKYTDTIATYNLIPLISTPSHSSKTEIPVITFLEVKSDSVTPCRINSGLRLRYTDGPLHSIQVTVIDRAPALSKLANIHANIFLEKGGKPAGIAAHKDRESKYFEVIVKDSTGKIVLTNTTLTPHKYYAISIDPHTQKIQFTEVDE